MNDDTIRRQEAIDALERIFDRCEEIEAHFPDGDPDKTGYEMFPDYMTVWKYLHQLPSAERLGRWEKIELSAPSGDYVMFQCSECASLYYEPSSYCPNCGARMEVE